MSRSCPAASSLTRSTRKILCDPRKSPNLLTKLRATVRSVKETERTYFAVATRAKENDSPVESNAEMRSIFVSRFWCFLVQWETFLDLILAFDSTLVLGSESFYLARVVTAKYS